MLLCILAWDTQALTCYNIKEVMARKMKKGPAKKMAKAKKAVKKARAMY